MKRSFVLGIIVAVIIIIVTAYISTIKNNDSDSVKISFSGYVTNNIDGDTIEIEHQRIRLSLTSTPELNEDGGIEAKEFTDYLCPMGSPALVVVDGGQLQDKYGRTVAKVYCGGILLNSALLDDGLAVIDTKFCSESEFATEDWAVKYGC